MGDVIQLDLERRMVETLSRDTQRPCPECGKAWALHGLQEVMDCVRVIWADHGKGRP